MAGHTVLTLVAVWRMSKIGRKILKDSKWYLYDYNDGRTMELPAEPSLLRCGVSGAEVPEGGHLKVKLEYQKESFIRGIFMENAKLARRRYSVNGSDLMAILTLDEQDALTKPARLTTSSAVSDIFVWEL